MTLATARPDGAVSSRVIAIKRVDQHGLVFGTHASSRKGREVEASPWAAGTFHWRETIQQLNVAGRVERLPEAAVRGVAQAARPIPRPVTWHAYRLVPDRLEFWCGSPDRLHLRLEYERAGGSWTARRLQP